MNVRARNRAPSGGTHLDKMCGALRLSCFVGFLLISAAAFLVAFPSPLLAQKPPSSGGHPNTSPPPPPPPKLPTDSFDQNQLLYGLKGAVAPRQGPDDFGCFLPPLNRVQVPTVPSANLQAPPKAKKEYSAACASLKDQKYDAAEDHLRKALKQEPHFPAAWVTLGQILAARQRSDEARAACSQALSADPGYLPPYLCLTDIAARSEAWDEALQLSGRALELEPASDFIAYGYNAAAYLNLHKLPEAEKSALRALEIDKNNADPRVHFLLAQIYEAKKDLVNEAAQLREYLKFADSADAAMVSQVLADLEKRPKN
jgi:tetratricopeptide (TPR) repeat protein